MKKILITGLFACLALLMANFNMSEETPDWDDSTPVSEVLAHLGDKAPKHQVLGITDDMIRQGREIVWEGRTDSPGIGKSAYVSKYYVCTSCHNMEIEDPDIRKSDPDARLTYAKSKGLPFLQATTFYGMVNRESWYNDDYFIKYGDLVKPARESLAEAVQLCAQECSQGRKLKQWELDAVLAYCWSIGYKMGDLNLSDTDWKKLKSQAKEVSHHKELRNWLKSFYALKSPATFSEAPPNKEEGYANLTGNASKGKDVYEQSCLQCHKAMGVSQFLLENSSLSMQKLKKHITKDTPFSVYEIIRHGTHAEPGHRQYMPHFTLERMSNQQVEDLRAYIESYEDSK